jgi:hypothetical protein
MVQGNFVSVPLAAADFELWFSARLHADSRRHGTDRNALSGSLVL